MRALFQKLWDVVCLWALRVYLQRCEERRRSVVHRLPEID